MHAPCIQINKTNNTHPYYTRTAEMIMNIVLIVVLAIICPMLLATPAAGAFVPSLPLFGGIGAGVAGRDAIDAAASAPRRSPAALQLQAASAATQQLEAILFDCDGVLADTERDGHRISFNLAFKNNGIDEDWSEERYGKLLEVGGGKERMTAHWNEVGWPDQLPEEGRSDKIKQLHLQKTELFMKLIDDGQIPLRPGVLRLVDEAISQGIKLAVCSTSSELAVSNLVHTLMGEERASKFQIFAGDMVKKKKPAPDVYLMAVDTMKLDKSKCVIVEDSHIGVGAAVAAGISCLVTKSSYTALEDFTGAKMIVDELGNDASTGITIETLSSLLEGASSTQQDAPVAADVVVFTSSWDRVGHVETTGASWTGARFGDQNRFGRPQSNNSSESNGFKIKGKGSIGVKMKSHVESGGASWTGARFGEGAQLARTYTASETYEFKSKGKSAGAQWDAIAHVEVPPEGSDTNAWSGARFGDKDGRRCAPTPSKWHE